MGKETIAVYDDQYHLLTFDLDDEGRLNVYFDGVKIEGSDHELAVKIFEHGLWFKFQPIDTVEGYSQKEIADQMRKGKKGRNRKR